MRQISIKQLHSATSQNIKDWLPCGVVSDGEIIAQIVPLSTVSSQNVALAKADINYEVPLSKTQRLETARRAMAGITKPQGVKQGIALGKCDADGNLMPEYD